MLWGCFASDGTHLKIIGEGTPKHAKNLKNRAVWGNIRTVSKKRILISAAGGLAVLVVGGVLYAYYDFTHNFRLPLTTQQLSNAQIAFKGALGEAIFSEQLKAEVVPAEQLKGKSGLDALFASAPAGNEVKG